jgi:hypothetical protein
MTHQRPKLQRPKYKNICPAVFEAQHEVLIITYPQPKPVPEDSPGANTLRITQHPHPFLGWSGNSAFEDEDGSLFVLMIDVCRNCGQLFTHAEDAP